MKRTITLALVGFTAVVLQADAAEPEESRKPLPQRPVWRLEVDNDLITDSDDSFTAGGSLQRHSAPFDVWEQKKRGRTRKGLSLWIGRNLPGLGDDGEGGRIVRRTTGLAFLMQTPEDIENPDPQPEDVPWAGTAGVATSWYSLDNRRLAAFQVYLGCMGPCSGAEQVQKFVHDDLGFSDNSPRGWDNQLDNELLANLNYGLRYKVAAPREERYAARRFAGDLALGGQVGIGNYFSLAEALIELRFGWGLPMGFTHLPDPAGRGILSDPVYTPLDDATALNRTRVYFSLVPRFVYFGYVRTLEGGDTENGGYHPGVDYDQTVGQLVGGFHIARRRFAFHFNVYYFPEDVINTPTGSSLEWTNFSFEYRF